MLRLQSGSLTTNPCLVLEREQAERREAESAVSDLKKQFSTIKEKCASVDVEIDQYTEEVNTLRRG